MKICELKNPIKACHFILNENENESPLWNIIWNNNIDEKLLKLENGRCYYIVVGEEIYKIGYSDCKGGIKSTINAYRSSGNSGRPSDRTHGIHILISEKLLLRNKVEVYFHYNELVSSKLSLMNGSSILVENSISGKILESKNIEIYKNIENKFPEWNLQESGKPWPTYIQESRKSLLSGNKAKLSEIKERLF